MNKRIRDSVVLSASFLLCCLTSYAAPVDQEQFKTGRPNVFGTKRPGTKVIDLRSATRAMRLKDGRNLIHSDAHFKLYGNAKAGKITGWYAVDDKGNTLPTTVAASAVECSVCTTIKTNGQTKVCVVIDCDKIVIKPDTAPPANVAQ